MADEEFIDFKKEFENFKKELENSKPLFDDENIEFTDFDDLSSINSNFDDLENSKNTLKSKENMDLRNTLKSNGNPNFPNMVIEDENIIMNLTIKKDYSKTHDLNQRHDDIIDDLKDLIEEFSKTNEFNDLLKYYNNK